MVRLCQGINFDVPLRFHMTSHDPWVLKMISTTGHGLSLTVGRMLMESHCDIAIQMSGKRFEMTRTFPEA